MFIWGVSEETLERIAAEVGVSLSDSHGREGCKQSGRALSCCLRPLGERWRKIGRNGRRVNAVCYHGHYAFMRRVFEEVPAARIKSWMADYKGQQVFLDTARDTGYTNVGSQADPLRLSDACECTGFEIDKAYGGEHCR